MQIGSTEALKAQMEKCIVSDCKDCPYTDAQICDTAMTKDALEYIESLEERIAIMQESMEALEKHAHELEGRANQMKPTQNPLGEWVCKCGRVIDMLDNYCPECGQAVKWVD